MKTALVCIMAGLGTRYSNAIIINLKERLERIDGCAVLAGSYAEYDEFASELRRSTADFKVIIGHSLGGSVAPETARRAGVPVAAIFGFDPASNIAANASQYKLTMIPGNVRLARAGVVKVPGLGGGKYFAESPSTVIENFEVDAGHLDADDEIERHLEIEEFVKRLVEA